MIPIQHFESVESTNLEASRRAAMGDVGPVWIVADRQTAGRGRADRSWISTPGNLFATLLMPFAGGPQRAALISYVAALAVARVLDGFIEEPGRISLKWPNDVLVEGRKISGILLESGAHRGAGWVAIGVGVNLVNTPSDTRIPAVSLSEVAAGQSPTAREAAILLRDAMSKELMFFETNDFSEVRTRWQARAFHLGEEIEARLPKETYRGQFEGIDDQGMLVLRTSSGTKRIASADVHFG